MSDFAEKAVERFIRSECLATGKGEHTIASSELFDAYREWADYYAEPGLSTMSFSKAAAKVLRSNKFDDIDGIPRPIWRAKQSTIHYQGVVFK